MINKFFSIVFIIIAISLSACGEKKPEPELENFKGKWLVINYWAQWCKPCRKEIPELNQLNQEHSELLEVVGVNFDRAQGEELQKQIKDLNIQFKQLKIDPAAMLGIARPAALPTTLILNPQGILKSTLAGPQTAEKILAEIDTHKAN